MSSHSSDAAPAPATTERNNLALASLIVGIVSLVLCVAFVPAAVGLVLGLVALKQIKSSGAGGRGMAIGGAVTSAVSLVLGVVMVATGAISSNSQPTARATSTPPSASAEPTSAAPSPRPSAPPSPTATATASVTDAEVVAAFQAYIDERASSGVVIAKAVTDVSFTDRVVRVTFDPAAAGIDQETFDWINPFENLAEFAGIPIAFNTDEGARLRPAIDAVETVLADGTPLGTMTTAEIYQMGTGEGL